MLKKGIDFVGAIKMASISQLSSKEPLLDEESLQISTAVDNLLKQREANTQLKTDKDSQYLIFK